MPRIPELTRENVPAELRDAFDAVMAEGKPRGPSSIAIHSPELARRRAPLSNYLRFETTIPDRILELAILVTARCLDCPYIWNAHADAARKAGVSSELVRHLCWNEALGSAPEDELALIAYGQELLRTHTVREKTFKDALEHFGTQHLVELTALMGTYAQNAFFLNAFGVELPADSKEPRMPVKLELMEDF
ncbi:MAG: carboxymuconolactone decarboxylase family protein [Chloroflexota bacterium]